MQEVFEHRPLLERDTLRALQQRTNGPSAVRLTLHLGAILGTALLLIFWSPSFWISLGLMVALSWMLSGVFAPFHECVHRTAFTSRALNALGAWPTGILFGMAPATYHAFHFEHHRFTQDAGRDPEIMADPAVYSAWPPTKRGWLQLASGVPLLRLKYYTLRRFLRPQPTAGEIPAPWEPTGGKRWRLVWQSWIVIGFWAVLVVLAVTVAPAVWWLLTASVLAHVWQNLWIASEHTGLPLDGTILARTRTVRSNRFVRWWLWNMNYHAEHHAWPGIPWHQLPAAHALVAPHLDHAVSGYTALHRNVYQQRNMPSADA